MLFTVPGANENADYGSVSVISVDESYDSPDTHAHTLSNQHIMFDKCNENILQRNGSLNEMTKLLSSERSNGVNSPNNQSEDQVDDDSVTMVTGLLLETTA